MVKETDSTMVKALIDAIEKYAYIHEGIWSFEYTDKYINARIHFPNGFGAEIENLYSGRSDKCYRIQPIRKICHNTFEHLKVDLDSRFKELFSLDEVIKYFDEICEIKNEIDRLYDLLVEERYDPKMATTVGGFYDKELKVFLPNGYGVSVVFGPRSYGFEEDLLEVAVIKGNEDGWEITYDTPIISGIMKALSAHETLGVVKDVEKLDKLSDEELSKIRKKDE